jgi:uncharacterized protein (DUF1330 family)
MYIHPDDDQLSRMGDGDPDEPVVMLNLVRYAGRADTGAGVDGLTGEEAYRRYGQAFAQLHDRFGGEPVWLGSAGNTIIGASDEQWDIVILVRYPTRRQFVEMLADPEYRAIAPMRAAALEDSRLIECSQIIPPTDDGS